MAQVNLIMPKMGESIAEATIIRWLKRPGDPIQADESVLEIATDKVDSEVPSPVSGFLAKQLFAEGETIKVGETIALITTEAGETLTETAPALIQTEPEQLPKEDKNVDPSEIPFLKNALTTEHPVLEHNASEKFYSPLVRNIAHQEGISLTELDKIAGTGIEGRVTKKDVLQYLENRKSPQQQTASSNHTQATTSSPITTSSLSGNIEIMEMDRMRKLIAEHMIMSKQTSPHVTSFVEADVTNIVLWREKVKTEFEKREKEKITYTPIFIEAVAQALKDFPMVNVSLEGTKILVKKFINIGMATALPSGNLIVPVIKNADRMNLVGLTKTVNDLASRARNNKLQPEEIKDGTFTITNVGSFGNVMGTPIINQPQVAILAVGAIKKKPAVIETPQGDTIGIRHMMFLSLSYDHRIVDGALGGSFLRRIADYLEKFDINRTF